MSLDLISDLLVETNSASVCVMLYNIKCGVAYESSEDVSALTASSLTPLMNSNVHVYSVSDSLAKTIEKYNLENISTPDFGITILMMHFARYYSKGQYLLFFNIFKPVKELEFLEKFLLDYSERTLRLPYNMATHDEYNLLKFGKLCTDIHYLSVASFNTIVAFMRSPNVTPQLFMSGIKHLHISIIESIYMFTSITKDCKVIVECRALHSSSMNYSFINPTKKSTFDGDYWFHMPHNSVWFAYHKGKVAYKMSYVSRDTDSLTDVLSDIPYVVEGFIHDNQLYPIILKNPFFEGNWTQTIQTLQKLELKCALNPSSTLNQKNKIFFVKNNDKIVYVLIKN